MANFPFGRFREETEVRKPSKAFLIFSILFLLLLILSATFIALYIVEKTKSTDSSSGTCATPTCITSAAGMLGRRFPRDIFFILGQLLTVETSIVC